MGIGKTLSFLDNTKTDLLTGLKKDFSKIGSNIIVRSHEYEHYDRVPDGITTIAESGATHILICVWIMLDSDTGSICTQEVDDSWINDTIDNVVNAGVIPVLKIHIGFESEQNPAIYMPSSPSTFFINYKACLLHLASLCSAKSVKYMTIANEMKLMTTTTYNNNWLDIFQSIKKLYNNIKLGCSLTFDEINAMNGIIQYVDVIGWNIYPWLSETGLTDTVEDLVKKWQRTTNGYDFMSVLRKVKRRYPDKEFWFTEFGCLAQDDGLQYTAYAEGVYNQNFEIIYKYYLSSFYYWGQSGLLDGLFYWVGNVGHGYNSLNWSKTKELTKLLNNLPTERQDKTIYPDKSIINRWLSAKELINSPIKNPSGSVNVLLNLYNDRSNSLENNVIYFPAQTNYVNSSVLSLQFAHREFFDIDKTYKVTLKVKKESEVNLSAQIICDVDKIGTFRKSLNKTDISSARYKDIAFYITPNRIGGRTLVYTDFVNLNICCIKNGIDKSNFGFYLSALKIEEVQTSFSILDANNDVREIEYSVVSGLQLKSTKSIYTDFYHDAQPTNLITNPEMTNGQGINPDRYCVGYSRGIGPGTTNIWDTIDELGVQDKNQLITVTASTTGGVRTSLTQTITGLTVGDVLDFGVEAKVENVTGTFTGRIALQFLDSNDASLGANSVTFTNTDFTVISLLNNIAPANSVKCILYFQANIVTVGDTGSVRFRNSNLYKNII